MVKKLDFVVEFDKVEKTKKVYVVESCGITVGRFSKMKPAQEKRKREVRRLMKAQKCSEQIAKMVCRIRCLSLFVCQKLV